MQKSAAIIKTDTEENWNKAINYIPDCFTVIIYQYEDAPPKIKLGDGVHKLNELPFLNSKSVDDSTLCL